MTDVQFASLWKHCSDMVFFVVPMTDVGKSFAKTVTGVSGNIQVHETLPALIVDRRRWIDEEAYSLFISLAISVAAASFGSPLSYF